MENPDFNDSLPAAAPPAAGAGAATEGAAHDPRKGNLDLVVC